MCGVSGKLPATGRQPPARGHLPASWRYLHVETGQGLTFTSLFQKVGRLGPRIQPRVCYRSSDVLGKC